MFIKLDLVQVVVGKFHFHFSDVLLGGVVDYVIKPTLTLAREWC